MKLLLINLVFLVLISHICADEVRDPIVTRRNVGSRIVGGTVARAGQYKFMAAIHVQTSTSKFFCGGSLLGNQWILTAGLCVYDGVLFTVQLGSLTLNDEDENRVILATSHYYLHPDFDPDTLDNDIGIIELRMSVMLNGYIQPGKTSILGPNNTKSFALGFGQTSDYAELSNELRYVEVTTITNEECQVYYGSQITDSMLCVAGNYNEGTCTGDNGSPLIVTSSGGKYSAVVGIASFISGNGCEAIHPSGYTRVGPYRDWIFNITSWM